jgi:hypothetical protein
VTFLELQTEFYARGFSYLNEDAAGRTRAKAWLNEGYLEDICADEPWDFLRTSTSSVAPLTISDLDTIISVVNTTHDYPLTAAEAGQLDDAYYDLTLTGSPLVYYFTGDTALDVFPANTTDTIQVRYYKVPTELSADGDTPLVPTRWHGLIVDFAAIRAYIDSDNFEAAQWLEARANRRLDKMRAAQMVRDPHPRFIQPTSWDV